MAKTYNKYNFGLVIEFLLVFLFIIIVALAISPPEKIIVESPDVDKIEHTKINDFVVYYSVASITASNPNKI